MLSNVSVKSTFTGTEGSIYVRRTLVFVGRVGVLKRPEKVVQWCLMLVELCRSTSLTTICAKNVCVMLQKP